MRAVWCGFALGVMALQQQATLPGWRIALALATLALAMLAWAVRVLPHEKYARRAAPCRRAWRTASGWCAVLVAAACAGFGYAAWRAQARLSYALPVDWQSRAIDVTGHIASLPSYSALGVRFLFDVDTWGTPAANAHWPRTIQLAWIPPRERQNGAESNANTETEDGQNPSVAPAAPALPILEPGARWRLPVRLKRPHGNDNFGLRDAEVALLERNVRATGYISAPERAQHLDGDAHGIGISIERWRDRVRRRIDAVLGDAPHRGIVIALANGAQDAISDDDWQTLRRSGTSHLVAVSGMHIALVAGLTGWLTGALWRRLTWRGFVGPLAMPAQSVTLLGAVCAATAYAALAGFNVPAQRALWMLVVAAAILASRRRVARSQVLAWALGLILLRDPWAVCAAGFWLSFGAVGAILFALSGMPRVPAVARAGTSDAADITDAADVTDPSIPNASHAYRCDAHGNVTRIRKEEEEIQAAAGNPASASHGRWFQTGRAVRHRYRHGLARFIANVRDGARVQWAITLVLAPLTVYWFSQIPLVGPLANAFAIPCVSLLVTPLVLVGAALPGVPGACALHTAYTTLDWLMHALAFVSSPSWAVWQLPQPNLWTLACAMLGAAWCLAPRGWPLRWAAPCAWLPLLLPAPPGVPYGAFRLTALDIGQGSSVLIETAGHSLLFDAGPGPESTHAGERIVVPYLQAHGLVRLDALVISHDDSDHSGGTPAVLNHVKVRQFVAGIVPTHPLWAHAQSTGAQTVRCSAGQHWQWDGVRFEMLWPDPGPLDDKTNDHCCVLRVSRVSAQPSSTLRDGANDEMAALLTADIEAPVERILLDRSREALRAQVLMVAHHGSRTSSSEPFIDAVSPSVAIFQVGYLNRFHHPNAGVYARYKARAIALARSDWDGATRVDVPFVPSTLFAVSSQAQHSIPDATLDMVDYRTVHRRYWMDGPPP